MSERSKRTRIPNTNYSDYFLDVESRKLIGQQQKQDIKDIREKEKAFEEKMGPIREKSSKALSQLIGNSSKVSLNLFNQSGQKTKSISATVIDEKQTFKDLLKNQYVKGLSSLEQTNLYFVAKTKAKAKARSKTKQEFSTPLLLQIPPGNLDGKLVPLNPVEKKKNTYSQPANNGAYEAIARRMDNTVEKVKKRDEKLKEKEALRQVNNDIINQMKMQELEGTYDASDIQNIAEFASLQRFEQLRAQKTFLLNPTSSSKGTGGLKHIADTLKSEKSFEIRYGSGKKSIFKGVESAESLRRFDETDYSSDIDLMPTKKRKRDANPEASSANKKKSQQ